MKVRMFSKEVSSSEKKMKVEHDYHKSRRKKKIQTVWLLTLSELQNLQKDYSHCPGEHIATWLLRFWGGGTSTLNLTGSEAKKLASVSRESTADKAIGKGIQSFTFWWQLLSAVKERYPFKKDVVLKPGIRTTMEYLRELSVVETMYGINLDNNTSSPDADDMIRRWPLWQRVVWNAPSPYASTLAGENWKDDKKPVVDEKASLFWQYEDSPSSSPRACVSAAEKLVRQLKAKETASTAPPAVWTCTSSIRSKPSSAQERGYSRYTPCTIRWFYPRDGGEDMRKWDGKPTSTLQSWVLELQGKTITTVGLPWNMEASVSSRQFSRQQR